MLVGNNLQIYVKTTETCNLNCDHCFTSGSQGKKIYFNPEQTLSFVRELATLPSTQNLRLVLHGGEPMLAPIEDLQRFIAGSKELEKVTSYGIQTNLVYTLTPERLSFLNETFLEYGIGTSWDADLRFGKLRENTDSSQLKIWEENVKVLVKNGHNLTLMVCLSQYLLENYSPNEIIEYAIDLGFKHILFERITNDGHAKTHSNIFPSNKQLDAWLLNMFEQTLEHQYFEKINNMLLSELAQAFIQRSHTANRCRNCELHLFTINADGNLSGCPNSATSNIFGHISKPLQSLLTSTNRIGAICKEKIRHDICATCPVRSICNGDCYKLPWQGEICAAPKSIMLKMQEHNDIEQYEKLL